MPPYCIKPPFQYCIKPTYENSSASISELIEPFDGLDQNYTPEEDLQHIGVCDTFSSGLQHTTDHEHKFWNAKGMVFA